MSELLRLDYVSGCVDDIVKAATNRATPEKLIPYFLPCAKDASLLDKEKLEKELADPKFSAYTRTRARIKFGFSKRVYAATQDALTKLAEKKPAVKRIAFDVPQRAWDEWMKAYEANKAAIDDAWKFEEDFQRDGKTATQGCGEKLRAHLWKYIAEAKPESHEAAVARATDQVGHPLLWSWAMCEAIEGNIPAATAGYVLLGGSRFWRGPREAMYWAVAEALADEDNQKLGLTPTSLRGRPSDEPYKWLRKLEAKKQYGANAEGQIAAVKKQGEGLYVTFKKVSWKEPVFRCTETNKIDRISESGQVIYRQECVQTGTETVEKTETPVLVPAAYATGLKAGQFAKFRSLDAKGGQERTAVPEDLYTNMERKKLVGFLGATW